MQAKAIHYYKLFRDVCKVINSSLDLKEVLKLIAENIAGQLERRISHSRAMKRAAMQAMRQGVEGVRAVSGSLTDIVRGLAHECLQYPPRTRGLPVRHKACSYG